jgi:hypothetical protein
VSILGPKTKVVAVTALKEVDALSIVETVRACATVQPVVSRRIPEAIPSVSAERCVIACSRKNMVVRGPAEDDIRPITPIQLVVPIASIDHVGTTLPVDEVVFTSAANHI